MPPLLFSPAVCFVTKRELPNLIYFVSRNETGFLKYIIELESVENDMFWVCFHCNSAYFLLEPSFVVTKTEVPKLSIF